MAITSISGPFGAEIKAALIGIGSEDGGWLMTEDGDTITTENDITLETGSGGHACCPASIFMFSNAEQTVIGYNQDLINKHGQTPRVNVFYYNGETGFYAGGAYTRVSFDKLPVTKITVNHGGPNSGFVKLV